MNKTKQTQNMKLKKLLSVLLAVLCLCFTAKGAQITSCKIADMAQLHSSGYAGMYVGHINGRIILAGGSDFSKGFPWEGGQKQYSDNIYIISADAKQIEVCEQHLPKKLAHGCAQTVGQNLYLFGGHNAEGDNQMVYMIETTTNQQVKISEKGCTPKGFKPVAAIQHEGKIYVHGIEEGQNALYLYLTASNQWQKLAACPALPHSEAVQFAGQHNGSQYALYLIGGRGYIDGQITPFSDVWEYLPLYDQWVRKNDIEIRGEKRTIMGAGCIQYGSGHILVFGGDDGKELFERDRISQAIKNETDPQKRSELEAQLREAFTSHAGFSSEILAYHAITDSWAVLGCGKTPFPVVTTALHDQRGDILLCLGENHPGQRTTEVMKIEIEEPINFGWVNYLVIFLYLGLMMLLGFHFVKKAKNTEQFFKGGSQIPWWAAGISIFATALSAITFISIPAKAYGADWGMFIFNIAIILIVPVVIYFYLPFFRKLKVASAYQYLEQRFSSTVRYFASIFFVVFMFARVAVVLFLPSLALNAVTGLNVYTCICLMGIVTIIYCTMGGIEAVVWGDVIQGAILVGGALLSLGYLIFGIEDGLGGMMEVAIENSKFNIVNWSWDWTQPVLIVTLLGGLANQLLTYTSDQSVIQRYITVKDIEGTKKGLWLNGLLSIPTTIIFFLIGTGLYVFFKENPEMLNVGMTNTDSIFPHFIMCRLPNGVAGLLIAAIFAAAMSTLSANINSTSTVLTEDFFRPFKKNVTEKQCMLFARISGIVIGSFGVILAIILATYDIASLWDQFNFFLGLFTSGLGGLFAMGIFTKRIGTRGAITGFVGSFITLLLFNNYTHVSYILYGFIGLTSCLLIGYISSFIYGRGK